MPRQHAVSAPGGSEEEALEGRQLTGGVAGLDAGAAVRQVDHVGVGQHPLGNRLDVARERASGQPFGHGADHVAPLERRAGRRQASGPTEASHEIVDLLGARRRPVVGAEQVVEGATARRFDVETQFARPLEPTLAQPRTRQLGSGLLGSAGGQGGRLSAPGRECSPELRGAPSISRRRVEKARSTFLGIPSISAMPRSTGPKRTPRLLAEAGPQRGLVEEAGGAGMGVEEAGVGGRPGAVGPFGHVGHQHVGVELGVAGPRGAMHEGGGHHALAPPRARGPRDPDGAAGPGARGSRGPGRPPRRGRRGPGPSPRARRGRRGGRPIWGPRR